MSWLQDPKTLFSDFNVIPNDEMNNNEKVNTVTRLVILITIGLYFLGSDQYFTILILGLMLIAGYQTLLDNNERENFHPGGNNNRVHPEVSERQALSTGIRGFDPSFDSRPHVQNPVTDACWFNQDISLLNAAFEITPPIQFNHDDEAKRSYMNAKYELIPLTDTDGFKEIWRSEPGMCGGYSMTPDPLTEFPVESPDARGQCNYIVRSGIDHLPISQAQNALNSVRPMAEAAYNESILNFRDGIMNEHIDRFRRERQHNCPDMKLSAGTAGAGGSI